MKKRNYKSINGFTLIELILALALISFVIIVSTNLIVFGTKAHKMTINEYEMQSAIRRATESTNQIIRYSKAVFAVPSTFVSSTEKMDPEWDFFMVSSDKKKIVTMEYNVDFGKHEEKVLVGEKDNIIYEVYFEKDLDANTDSVMKYKIYAFITDKDGKKSKGKLVFESTVESINAIQVADKGSVASPSIALAYRNDGQTSGKGKNQIAYVTLVVDVSGSMGDKIDRNDTNNKITNVINALKGDTKNPDKGIVQQFSKEENIFISIVPFSSTGNYPNPTSYKDQYSQHVIHEVFNKKDKDNLVDLVSKLNASGGTNTGDGLRQAYYLHNDFRTRMNIKETDQVYHYMILLVDGETTYEVSNVTWKDEGYYIDPGKNDVTINKTKYKRFDWKTDWKSYVSNDYLAKGNINLSYLKSFSPTNDTLKQGEYYSGYINYMDSKKLVRYPSKNSANIVLYGKENNSFNNVLITGDGSKVIDDSKYIKAVGGLIRNFESGNGVKSYIIGYEKGLMKNIKDIGTSIGTDTRNIYSYEDKGFNLDEILKNIANDIIADFWLVSGPQIQNLKVN